MTAGVVEAWHSCINALADKQLSGPPPVRTAWVESVAPTDKTINAAVRPQKDATCKKVV